MHVEKREEALELVTCKSARAVSGDLAALDLNCEKAAAKALLPRSCWGEGAPPAPTFPQPEAVLQNRPRKEETRAKSRQGGQQGPVSRRTPTRGG